MPKCDRCGAFIEAAATACTWCGAGGDNGSAESFVVPRPAAAPPAVAPPAVALAEASAAPALSLPAIPDAPLRIRENNLQGIGGWLIVVAIGLALGPFALLLGLGGVILLFLGPESQTLLAAHPGFGGVLFFEAVVSAILLAAFVILNFLFYKKKKIFPRAAMAFLVLNFVLDVAVHQMMQQYFPKYPATDAFLSLALAAIWIPYLLISQRVKLTFVN